MKSITFICLALFTLTTHSLPLFILPPTQPTHHLSTRQQSSDPTEEAALEQETDTLLFSTSMSDFLTAKADQDPPELDWISNGCTASPDKPLGYSFTPSCNRHDFGYHNYKEQGRFTDENKHLIDLNFKNDMYAECAKHGFLSGSVCRGVANVYYEAVSVFGSVKRRAVKARVVIEE